LELRITVIIQGFEREKLHEQLATLSQRHWAAFAVACAERLMPLYRWFEEVESWGDEKVLSSGIELVWSWIITGRPSDAEIAGAVRDCENAAPNTEDFSSPLVSRALDAAATVALALEVCISPLPDTAADAGQIAWDCAFGIEQSRLPNAGKLTIANRELLQQAARGSFVLLEESLQEQSLARLRCISLTREEADDFRKTFSQLSG
jgi:uncharacterized protein YjaG (DUF416 family)